MPSYVGALQLPLPAGAQDSAVVDPVVQGFLDYLAFFLNLDLSMKLANLRGTSSAALTTSNKFPWDPANYFVRGAQDGNTPPVPALYCWWSKKSKPTQWTLTQWIRTREISAVYIFDELVIPGAYVDRYGLMGAVDAVFEKAAALGSHPSFAPTGFAAGTPFATAYGILGNRPTYIGGEQGILAPVPAKSRSVTTASEQPALRAYPCMRGVFEVSELISDYDLSDADVMRDGEYIGREDGVKIVDRYIPAPDGTGSGSDFPQD